MEEEGAISSSRSAKRRIAQPDRNTSISVSPMGDDTELSNRNCSEHRAIVGVVIVGAVEDRDHPIGRHRSARGHREGQVSRPAGKRREVAPEKRAEGNRGAGRGVLQDDAILRIAERNTLLRFSTVKS